MDLKHSGIGISSFIVSIVAGILVFFIIMAAGVVEVSTPDGMDDNSATAMIISMSIILLLMMELVSLGLGIGGLCQKERKKTFAILGTVFSSVTLLGTILLI